MNLFSHYYYFNATENTQYAFGTVRKFKHQILITFIEKYFMILGLIWSLKLLYFQAPIPVTMI